ncbi:class I SAM-dependent methyltransferase [Candidatus Saccharibacteria bacterium]|nr:class I SAM-dependent methyltransferase [Candidatus Saccharibacteria bacterium]
MPSSFDENKDVVKSWYDLIKPEQTVLDIGPGVGTYADLIVEKNGARWVGIEIWAPYIEKYELTKKYDELVVADARYVDFAKFAPIDLIIAGDMIEHIDRDEAVKLLEDFKSHAKNFIISIPIVNIPQEVTTGNVWETHHHQWKFDEMKELLGDGLTSSVRGTYLGYFLWRKPEHQGD